MEDNDPTGFKSSKGIAAKKAAKIKVFSIPKRSPDLNLMDFAIWKSVTTRMRRQERKFPRSKRETRAAYIARLRRTALNTPKSTVTKAIRNLQHRCKLLHKAKGGHIEEGGKH